MGLFGGLLGWEAFEERLPNSVKAIQETGISVTIHIVDIGFTHPNTYKITLKNKNKTRQVVAISTAGLRAQPMQIEAGLLTIDGGL